MADDRPHRPLLLSCDRGHDSRVWGRYAGELAAGFEVWLAEPDAAPQRVAGGASGGPPGRYALVVAEGDAGDEAVSMLAAGRAGAVLLIRPGTGRLALDLIAEQGFDERFMRLMAVMEDYLPAMVAGELSAADRDEMEERFSAEIDHGLNPEDTALVRRIDRDRMDGWLAEVAAGRAWPDRRASPGDWFDLAAGHVDRITLLSCAHVGAQTRAFQRELPGLRVVDLPTCCGYPWLQDTAGFLAITRAAMA